MPRSTFKVLLRYYMLILVERLRYFRIKYIEQLHIQLS